MTELTRQSDRTHIELLTDQTAVYFKAGAIADDIGATPKSVAQHLRRLQAELTEISLKQWKRSKSVTWLVQKASSERDVE